MNNNKKYIAFIFARGGSKGIKNKNIKNFNGKPLIAYSITLAQSLEKISRVIVSTDSPEIARISEIFNAEVPFLRPKKFAEDDSPEWLAWRHALNFLKDSEGKAPSCLLSLPTTSPLRNKNDINNCLDCFETNLYDSVITVTESQRNPQFNMIKKMSDGSFNLAISEKNIYKRRQDAPIYYDITTVAYVVKTSLINNYENIFQGKIGVVNIPQERSIDIDTDLDFSVAEFLMKENSAN